MTSVFISSTSQDLADYRKAAVDTCIRLKLLPVAMQYFDAMPLDAVEGSKQQLEQADVYVGIFAHRYGYIPDGFEKSVTEIEFDYAGELNIPRLCFLVDPEYEYAWPVESIDRENSDKLEIFKERINKTLIRASFTTVDNFAVKLMHSLVQWQPTLENIKPLSTGIAPPRPTLVVGREKDFDNLKSRLSSPDGNSSITIIRGWPGVGKTTLVTALAYHKEIAARFPDGILWAQVGERLESPLTQLKRWATSLGMDNIGNDLEAAKEKLRTLLQNKRMLLIIDDIWQTKDAYPFQVGGPQCAVLATTRFQDVAREMAPTAEDIYLLEVLSTEKSLELLRRLAPTVVSEFPEKSVDLVKDMEGLPLAIRVAGRALEAEIMIDKAKAVELIGELRSSGAVLEHLAPDDRFDPVTGTTPTIRLLLQRSTDRLDAVTRRHFMFLGGFASKPATFDLIAMKAVWKVVDPLPSVRKLIDCGLLEPIPSVGRFWMHQLLVMHARSLLTSKKSG
jgi:hypothetical protein